MLSASPILVIIHSTLFEASAMPSIHSSSSLHAAAPELKANELAKPEKDAQANRAIKGESESAQKADTANARIEKESVATRQAKTNAATLKAHLDVSLGSKNNPMQLVYKAALDAINEELKPIFGDNAAEKIRDSGVDVSPEATAERIVSISTGFFSRYQEQNPNQSLEEQVDSFISVISRGAEQGFGEAKQILEGLGVLKDELQADIEKTFQLVVEGYENFRNKQLNNTETLSTDGTPK